MSLVDEVFGSKLTGATRAAPVPTGEPTAPVHPSVPPRDLIAEARRVPKLEIAKHMEVISGTQVAEEFRALRTNLLSIKAREGINSIVVSSCHHGEGKTTTAINLARFMAKARHRKVLLFDGDLRRPKIKEFLSLKPEVGLEDVLSGKADIKEALLYSEEDNLAVLPVRGGHSSATEMLDVPAMGELASLLTASFDYVICDTTPLLSTTDPCVLGNRMGGVVIVVRAGVTQRESVEHGKTILEQADVRLLGMVLNHVRFYIPRYLYRYQYYQDYYYRYYYGGEEREE